MELPGKTAFGEPLMELVKNGDVSLSLIDDAVARILSVKFKLGLFENPFSDSDRAVEIVNNPTSAMHKIC